MTRHVPNAGAFYSYIGVGLGRGWGLGSALVALVSYVTVQGAVLGYIGFALGGLVEGYGGPALPWWVWTFVVLAVTAVLGFRHIELSSKVLGVLLVAEVGIVLVLDAVVVGTGAPTRACPRRSCGPPRCSRVPPASGSCSPSPGSSVRGHRDLPRRGPRPRPHHPPRHLRRAGDHRRLLHALGLGRGQRLGDSSVVAEAAADPGNMVATTAQRYLGTAAADVIQVLLVTSLFAAVLSFHNVLSRYFFSLGNTGVVPAACGRSHARHASPHVASLVTTAIGVVLMAVSAIAGLDPVLEVFTWLAGIASVGIVGLMLLACVAVLAFFRRTGVDRRPGRPSSHPPSASSASPGSSCSWSRTCRCSWAGRPRWASAPACCSCSPSAPGSCWPPPAPPPPVTSSAPPAPTPPRRSEEIQTMTTTEDRTATHPLSRMTAAEIDSARELVTDAGLVTDRTVFVYVGLEEPHKRDVQEFTPGQTGRAPAAGAAARPRHRRRP